MIKDRLNQKYYPAIWAALLLASIFRFAYQIIDSYMSMTDISAARVTLSVLGNLFLNALLPSWLCYCCASILWSMAWRRGYRFIGRNDFIYITMIFTAAARVVMGIVEIFALVNGALYSYTSVLLDVTVLSAALYVMYFAVLVPKYMNPKQSYEVFSLYSMVYLLFQGLHTALPCVVYLLIAEGTAFYDTFGKTLEQAGYNFTSANENAVIASYVALGVLGAYIIATILLSAVLRKKALAYKPVEDENNDNKPYDNPFGDDFQGQDSGGKSDGNDKIFEDFDI